MTNLYKSFILFLIGGSTYTSIEILWRNKTDRSMFILSGLCFLLIGWLNEVFADIQIRKQCLLSALIITMLELITGLIFNADHNIWDYSQMFFNYRGQICLLYSMLWYFLSLPAIYLDDYLRYKLFDAEYKGNFRKYLREFLGRRN